MKNIFLKLLIFIKIIYFINAENNDITKVKKINTQSDLTKHEFRNATNNKRNLENKNISISNPPNILEVNDNNLNQQSQNKNLNITIYDKNKILQILTNSSNNSKIDENFFEDDDVNNVENVEHIIIENTHEDQLAESIFYFLSFILVIFIILFLYKFYQCYCQNAFKDFGDESTIKNPNNDPELQRISTHDDENIFEVTDI